MSMEETVTVNLEINLEPTYSELRKFEAMLYRAMGILKRFSGSEEIDKAITNIQKLIAVIRMWQMTIHAFMMATGPFGFAYASIMGLSTVMYMTSYGDASQEIRGHP